MNKQGKFKIPDSAEKLWRYMDLSKFLDIMSSGAIYYSGLDAFEDVFEGSLTRNDAYTRNMRQKYGPLTYNVDEIPPPTLNKEEKLKQKQNVRVSCWHLNKNESLAMWKLYLLSNQGIAIQTTVENIMEMTGNSKYAFYNGLVSYHDYRRDATNSYTLIDRVFQKRNSFDHEKEFRSVHVIEHDDTQFANDFFKIKCNLNQLIKKIVLAPLTPDWYKDMLKKTMEKFGYDFPIEKSEFEDIAPF